MKKLLKKIFKKRNILLAIFLIITISYIDFKHVTLDEYRVDKEFIASYDCQDERYTVEVYLGVGGGATTGFSINAICLDNYNGKCNAIYYGYHETLADVHWLSTYVININGETIDVRDGWGIF